MIKCSNLDFNYIIYCFEEFLGVVLNCYNIIVRVVKWVKENCFEDFDSIDDFNMKLVIWVIIEMFDEFICLEIISDN